MFSTRIPIIIAAAVVLGCSESAVAPIAQSDFPTLQASVGSRVVHRVSAAGSDVDFIGPGGDANFTLNALLRANGSASGQWTDEFGHGNGGFHAVINCVHVVGNQAWVSGIVTSGSTGGFDLTGLPVATRVADNGIFANDPPDEVSFSFIGDPTPCTDAVPYPLNTKTKGQVTVR